MQNNRLIIQIVTSLIFFWAFFQFIGDMRLIPLVIMAATGYIWYTNDYKFEVPRRKIAQMRQDRNRKSSDGRPLY